MSQNPYVGPRAFRYGERLPARRRELSELTDLLIAERVVLLHSPSGAGKTSFIRAGLAPLLGQERVGAKRLQTVLLRVKTPVPAGRTIHNRYVYSIALDLLPDRDPRELESLTLPEVLGLAKRLAANGIYVLIFDQFEEILTLDPVDREGQEAFFQELGSVLAGGDICVLFSMREDYIGNLDPFVPLRLPTYRLDLLAPDEAKRAIQEPAQDQNVWFGDEAADRLVRLLTTVRVTRPDIGVVEARTPYVEPFQLQVVCRRLWKSLAEKKGDAFNSIEADDVGSYEDISRALRRYYSDTVREVAGTTGAEESVIREWFETQLITAQRFRSQTQTGPPVSRDAGPGEILRALQAAYLIRSDFRAGATWYELIHDSLIEPILDSNETARRPPQRPSPA